jgi:hypothetical protein
MGRVATAQADHRLTLAFAARRGRLLGLVQPAWWPVSLTLRRWTGDLVSQIYRSRIERTPLYAGIPAGSCRTRALRAFADSLAGAGPAGWPICDRSSWSGCVEKNRVWLEMSCARRVV